MPEAVELHPGEQDCTSFSMDLLYNNKQELPSLFPEYST